MRRNNAVPQPDRNTNHATASGESPVPLASLPGPGAHSPARGVSHLVRRARPQDLKYLASLQAKYSNELGFLCTGALAWYIENQRVGIALENGEPAGYVLGRTHYRYQPLMRPITQTAVAMDLKRRQIGHDLVIRVCQQAVDARQLAVQAVCAEDLEANDFWAAIGFEPITVLPANNTRGRELIVWRKQLTHQRPDWFTTPPPQAGHRARRKGR